MGWMDGHTGDVSEPQPPVDGPRKWWPYLQQRDGEEVDVGRDAEEFEDGLGHEARNRVLGRDDHIARVPLGRDQLLVLVWRVQEGHARLYSQHRLCLGHDADTLPTPPKPTTSRPRDAWSVCLLALGAAVRPCAPQNRLWARQDEWVSQRCRRLERQRVHL